MMSCYCVIVVMFIVVMLYFLSLHYLYQPALVFCQLSNNSLRAYYLLLEAAIESETKDAPHHIGVKW